MRLPAWSPAVMLLAALACGKGTPSGQKCVHNFDCAAGEGCVNGACEALPCGGCQPDEACGADNNCVTAQGATCVDHTCPAAYPCNAGGICARPCVVNGDCDTGFRCNSALKSCTQCVFNADCSGRKDTPVCDTDPSAADAASGKGSCVACNIDHDCGIGHYCDAHVCKPGCKADGDCNASIGETCDTTAGKCVQCHQNSDCAAQGPTASACDDTGHCVQCWGTSPAQASHDFCSGGTPECNLASKTCVACLPANNQSGADCGYGAFGSKDPHDAQTCNGDNYSCVPGCQFDEQCGCPRTAPGGAESDCSRAPHPLACSQDADCGSGNHCGATGCQDASGRNIYTSGEACDPLRTTMAGVTGPTKGACVECATGKNTQCEYRVAGSTLRGGAFANLNGSRCLNDSCVEGCDADDDCWPDHATSNGKICHLGASGDPNNHKCVDCSCDSPGADPTYCESSRCSGAGKVCDTTTLLCRKKRLAEQCLASNECGDAHDPALGAGCVTTAFCIYDFDPYPTGALTYCDSTHGATGRCGIPCDSPADNKYCGATLPCPSGTSCNVAHNESSQNASECVPLSSCRY